MCSKLPDLKCERVIDCKQGAVRAVRYNGKSKYLTYDVQHYKFCFNK